MALFRYLFEKDPKKKKKLEEEYLEEDRRKFFGINKKNMEHKENGKAKAPRWTVSEQDIKLAQKIYNNNVQKIGEKNARKKEK